jgi:hypothetical protein
MQCPSCGYENVSGAERCASCGRPLPQTVGQGYGFPPSGEPPMPAGGPYQPPSSTPQQPFTSPGAPYGEMPGQPNVPPPGYGMPAPPSGYGMPTPQPGYGAPTPPSGYGTPAPPSGYGTTPPPGYGAPYPGYGQAAPPSYPMQPGQPGQPGWQYPPGYGPGGQPPQPPQRRSRTGLIVGIVIAVVVVIAACLGGTLLLASQAGNLTTITDLATPTTAAATATPAETVLFQSALTTSSSKMVQSEHCFFGTGGYHVKDNFICPINISDQTDVHVKVTAKQISGATDSPYGVAFRESSGDGWYELDISSDGSWGVFKCPANATSCSQLVQPSDTDAVQKNLNNENVLEVRTQGTQFEFFVNGTRLGQADDSSLTSGKVALSCGPGMECVYTNLTISKPAA